MKKVWFVSLFVVFILVTGCRSDQPEVSATRPTSSNALTVITRESEAIPTASSDEAVLEVAGQPETAVSPAIESAVFSEPPASPSAVKPTRQPVQSPTQEAVTGQQPEPTRLSGTAHVNPTPIPVNSATAAATTIATTAPLSETNPTDLSATPQILTTATPAIVNYDTGPIPAESLVSGILERDEIHSYSFSVAASSAISVTAVAVPDADIIVSVYNVDGDLIGEQNDAPAGELEQLTSLWLPSPGDYWVEVRTANNVPGQYLLMLLKPDSYAFHHQGMMAVGDMVTGSLAAQTDHFWFFTGSAGETVTITGVPGNGGDLFLELYDAAGENALGFVDEGISGNSEMISGYILPATGIYGIRVGEYDFRGVSYQLTLTRN